MNESLPRRALPALIGGYVLLCFVMLFGPAVGFILLFGGSAWNHFRDGGWMMFAVCASLLVALVAVGVLGGFAVRGRRIVGGVAFGFALTPAMLGALGAIIPLRMVDEVLQSELVEPSQGARILAEGISETENLLVLGYLAAGCAVTCVLVAATLAVLGIATPAEAPAGRRSALRAAIGTGAFFFAASLAARVLLHELSAFGLVPLLLLAAATLAAATCARATNRLAGTPYEDDMSFAWRSLALAAAAAGAAALFADLAASHAARIQALGAISGEAISPSQRATLLRSFMRDARWDPIVAAIDAIGGAAVFVAPLVASFSAAKKRFSWGASAIAASAALTIASVAAFGAASERLTAAANAWRGEFEVAGLELPRFVARPRSEWRRGHSLVVTQDATVTDHPGQRSPSESIPPVNVAADRRLTFDALVRAVTPALGKSHAIGLVVVDAAPVDRGGLGEFAGFVPPDLAAIDLLLVPSLEQLSKSYFVRSGVPVTLFGAPVAILLDGDHARVALLAITGQEGLRPAHRPIDIAVSAPSSGYAELAAKLESILRDAGTDQVLLAPRPSDTVEVVAAIASVIDGVPCGGASRIPSLPGSSPSGGGQQRTMLSLLSDRSGIERAFAAYTPPAAAPLSTPR